jgi:hypothetical protein
VALLEDVTVTQGEAVAEDETLMECVENLLRVPASDRVELNEGVALLLTHMEYVVDTQAVTLTDVVPDEHSETVGQLDTDVEKEAPALSDP